MLVLGCDAGCMPEGRERIAVAGRVALRLEARRGSKREARGKEEEQRRRVFIAGAYGYGGMGKVVALYGIWNRQRHSAKRQR